MQNILQNFEVKNSSSLSTRENLTETTDVVKFHSEMEKESKNLSMFVSISKFEFKSKEQGSRIYSSAFFNFKDPKTNILTEESYFEKLKWGLGMVGFENLIVLDIGCEGCWNNALIPFDGIIENTKLQILKISYEDFFTEKLLKRLSKISQREDCTIILHFNSKSWGTIKLLFKLLNINIGGNNNTIKHILSAQGFNLSIFILCLFGRETKYINNSLINIGRKTKVSRAIFDYTYRVDREFLNTIKNKIEEKDKANQEQSVKFTNNTEKLTNNTEKLRENKFKNNFSQKRGIHSARKVENKQINPLEVNKLTIKPTSNELDKSSNHLLYFESIKNIVEDNSLSNLDKQKSLENFLDKFVDQQIEEYDFETHKGQLLNINTQNIKDKLYDALETFNLHTKKKKNKEFYKILLNGENNPRIALKWIITAYGVIINYYNRLGYTAIATQIGKIIMENIFILEKRNNRKNDSINLKDLSFKEYLEIKNFNEIELIRLGDYFITLLTQFPHDIFTRNFSKTSITNKEVTFIEINSEYLDSIRENLIITPANLPMVAEPVKWSNKTYGGNLRNKSIKNEIVTKNSDNLHEIKNKTNLYRAVNILNSTKFGINTLLLNYLKNEGSYLLESEKIKDELQKEITIKLAEILTNTPFYLTVRSDWRGRLVTESFFLSYQGSDLSKSLVEFWDGESLTDDGKIDYYIHGANCHNIDNISKKSLEERKEWVEKNKEKIINLDKELINSAENIFSFATFCLNMQQLEKNPQWKVRTPIFLDATCSGIQHFSALLRDVELAMQVNLTKSNIKDCPKDVYSYLLEPINKAINDFGENNSLYSHFKLIKLNRKLIKQPIMTKIYNVTSYGISNQLQSNLESIKYTKEKQNELIFKDLKDNLKKENEKLFIVDGIQGKVLLTYSDLMQISKIINDNIFIVFPSLKGIYDYFIEIVRIVSDFNLPIWWITPCGLKITQHYLKVKENKTQFNVFNQAKKLVIREKTDELSKARQIQGIIPNVIHSLDASHLIKVISSSKKEDYYPIIAIHDCFGTHPNKMQKLETNVKLEFISLYSQQNYLKSFHKNVINNFRTNNFKVKYANKHYYVFSELKNEWIQLPNIPKLGNLDLNQIKESSYMIT